MSLLHLLFLHHHYNIITHYYISIIMYYYKIIITYYYIIITSLLHYYDFISTKGKLCKKDNIIMCYAKGKPMLLNYYYLLFRHYYTGF